MGVIALYPSLWLKTAEGLTKSQRRFLIVYFLFAVISGYFVFRRLSVVEIAAVLMFASAMIGLSLGSYLPIFSRSLAEMPAIGIGKFWLPMALWTALALWVLYSVLIGESGA